MAEQAGPSRPVRVVEDRTVLAIFPRDAARRLLELNYKAVLSWFDSETWAAECNLPVLALMRDGMVMGKRSYTPPGP